MPTESRLTFPGVPVLLLAAGRGERMRPLTDNTPKPLLQVRGRSLLAWRLEALQRDRCGPVVINTAWLGAQIEAALGDCFSALPQAPALALRYSHEGQDFGRALETAGAVVRALDQLGDIFWVMAGDVFAPDFVFSHQAVERFRAAGHLAHLWLVPNPPHHPQGDFALDPASGLASAPPAGDTRPRMTFSSIGLYRRALFQPPHCAILPGNARGEAAALAPLLRSAMALGRVSAEAYTGRWTDVGTPQRLEQLNQQPD